MRFPMSDSPIERYLDELYAQLRTDPRSARRLLDEAADHLHDAAAELERAGADRIDAETEAVRRFGASRPLVRADARRSIGRLALDTVQVAVLLGAVALIAIGVSGVLAAAMSVAFGRDFVGAQLPNWVSGPGGHPASVVENAHDAFALRALAGVVGLAALAAFWAVRRARPNLRLRVLPVAYVDLTGLVAFGGATVALGAASIDQIVNHSGHGAGFFLSGAIASVLGVAVFGVRAVRDLLRPGVA
jgi:hypothetical protein